MVDSLWRFNNWNDIVGGEWPSIEGSTRREPWGLMHPALRAFAQDICTGAA